MMLFLVISIFVEWVCFFFENIPIMMTNLWGEEGLFFLCSLYLIFYDNTDRLNYFSFV